MSLPNYSPTAWLVLVDDDQDNLDVLTVMLSPKYCVSSYPSATAALAGLEGVRPDLLLLDVGMGSDGLECLEAIRAVHECSSIPAIALTAYAQDVEKEAFLARGFQAVVTTSILNRGKLEELIDALLQSTRSLDPRHGHSGTSGRTLSPPLS